MNLRRRCCCRKRKRITDPNYFLICTSLLFVTNVLHALVRGYFVYAFLFMNLLVTSVLVHYEDTIGTNLVDKCSVFYVFLYGLYTLCRRTSFDNWAYTLIIVSTFLFVVWVYIYGFFNRTFVFDDKKRVSVQYHGLMHAIGSFGHNMIMLL
jgi:hypothetical protein